jgi:peptidoglycan/xylan/chitin deacetylase (PgdA/CDA1 family)
MAPAGVPATFFVTGRWGELYRQWARRIAAATNRHHTFDHQDLLGLSL